MKTTNFFDKLARHVCLICSAAILVIQILDWYNPFMDFMGHSMFLLYALCAGGLYLGLSEIFGQKANVREQAVSRAHRRNRRRDTGRRSLRKV